LYSSLQSAPSPAPSQPPVPHVPQPPIVDYDSDLDSNTYVNDYQSQSSAAPTSVCVPAACPECDARFSLLLHPSVLNFPDTLNQDEQREIRRTWFVDFVVSAAVAFKQSPVSLIISHLSNP
jgi:hypothetical protein